MTKLEKEMEKDMRYCIIFGDNNFITNPNLDKRGGSKNSIMSGKLEQKEWEEKVGV